MKRIVISWPGFTGYMGECWRSLARLAQVKIFIEPSNLEQNFDGSELEGLDWTRVANGDFTAVEREVRLFRPDLILVCGWSTPLSRFMGRTDFGSRKIIAFDMPWKWSLRKIAARFVLWPFLRHFDGAFVPGENSARYARWLGFRGRVMTGSNPSGWERFKDVKPSARGFVYVGRIAAEKGLDVLRAAYAKYCRQVEDPWPLDFIGGENFVRPAEMPQAMSKYACLVLPSRWEPWGIAAAEAMSAGLLTVLSDACGVIRELQPTVTFPSGDVDRLAAALIKIHRMDDAERAELGRRARAAAAEYSAANWARRLLTSSVAASFWEEHCTECGEPDCYRTCAKFTRGRGGRCRRFVGGLKETILNRGVETQFLPWGKMEALFHGRMISRPQAEELERLMTRTSWIRRIFPRWWRSWRWRWALLGSAKGVPNVWRCALTAERDEKLMFAVVGKRDEDVASTVIELKAGTRKESEIILPSVEKGTLFRIFPVNGEGTGRIRFEYNELVETGKRSPDRFMKCVAWDLDGTLWQGILSEDGAEGLTLNDKAVALLKELDGRGIVNSIVSRNDSEPALAALRKFGLEEYFVFPQINWGPKSEGIRNLAREMNIAVDAIAFIDDREEMRNEVRANLPEVRVFAADEIPALGQRPEFNPPVSAESAGRRLRYREEMARRGAMRTEFAGDAAAFLKASGLQFELLPVEGDAVVRCRELVQRTNQLNLTGRRYDEAAFAALLSAADCKAVHVWDRYGDYGIVGFAAMRGTHLVEFCFSCRVAEKGIERRVLEKLANGRTLTADSVETARNGKIREIVREWC